MSKKIAKQVESGDENSYVPQPDFGDMTLKVSQYSNHFNEDSRFALSIDPIAESLATFELIKDGET